MASASRLTHDGSTCFPALAGRGRSSHVEILPEQHREMVTDRVEAERTRHPEGPGERPASLSGTQTLRSGMKPCSTPGKPTFGIGYDRPIHDHNAQQLGGQRRGTAADARPNGI